MVDNNPKKNERLRGRNDKYKENYNIEVHSVHGVSEYEPKEDTFALFANGKENRLDEHKQRDDTVQNKNENLIETYRRERNSSPVDSPENRYNHSKAKGASAEEIF